MDYTHAYFFTGISPTSIKRIIHKIPEFIYVRGCCFALADPPSFWTENKHGELTCDKCGRHLVVLFAARKNPDITAENLRWWVPTAMTCACLAPKSIVLHSMPVKLRRRKRDARQLEFQV